MFFEIIVKVITIKFKMRTLKRLTLNKEVIANLSDNEMNRLLGRDGYYTPVDNTFVATTPSATCLQKTDTCNTLCEQDTCGNTCSSDCVSETVCGCNG